MFSSLEAFIQQDLEGATKVMHEGVLELIGKAFEPIKQDVRMTYAVREPQDRSDSSETGIVGGREEVLQLANLLKVDLPILEMEHDLVKTKVSKFS